MDSTRFIASLNALFVAKAADISHLSEIDETISRMLAHPKKKAAVMALQYDLSAQVDKAFSNQAAEFAKNYQLLPSETALRLLAEDVFEELATANPNILRPLLKRDIDVYLGVILAVESIRSDPNYNDGPK